MSKFSLRKAVSDSELEPFEFEDLDGETRQLPHVKALTQRQANSAVTGEVGPLLQEVAPVVADQLMDLPTYALEQLVTEWMRHSGIEFDAEGNPIPGKSTSTSPSSKGTATSSRRTSRSGASGRSKR